MTNCRLEISGVPARIGSIAKRLPGAQAHGEVVSLPSALGESCGLNDHLVWLWGMLVHERRFLKRLQQDGAVLVCRARTTEAAIKLKPNGAQMLHLLEASLVVEKT